MSTSQSSGSPRSSRFAKAAGFVALGLASGALAFVLVNRVQRPVVIAATPVSVVSAGGGATEREAMLVREMAVRDAQIAALLARAKPEEAVAMTATGENEALRQQVRGLAEEMVVREREAAALKEQIAARDRQIASWAETQGRLEARLVQLEGANLRQEDELARLAMEMQTAIAALTRPVVVATPAMQSLPAKPQPVIRYPDVW